MKHTIITVIVLLFINVIPAFSQNISGNNNTVIIQMQGNNNSVSNSSNNYSNNRVNNTNNSAAAYKTVPIYFETPSSGFFNYYTYRKYGYAWQKVKFWGLELYKNRTYRLTTPTKTTEGIFDAVTCNSSNDTYTLYVYVDGLGYVKDQILRVVDGKIALGGEIILKETLPRTEYNTKVR